MRGRSTAARPRGSSGGRRANAGKGEGPLGRRAPDLLGSVPLFEGLSRRHLRRLAEHADVVRFRERQPIVEAGRPGGTFYVLLEGSAKVVRGGRTVGGLAPGEFFGEISLLDGGPRTATVVAQTPVTAVRIFKRSFDRLMREEPAAAQRILAVVARRLREAERSIRE